MTAMTSVEVCDALLRRWPDSEYLTIREAPLSPSRQGRKLDVLVASLWRSRGYELDGVEVKVSYSDWKRERDNPAKADGWWDHVHRFWVATPVPLCDRVRDELPAGWGLLACNSDAAPAVVVKPERHTPTPFTWPETVGLLRSSADSGTAALYRAEQRGYDRGYTSGKLAAERQSEPGRLQERVDSLTAAIATFEAASGLKVHEPYGFSAERSGRIAAFVSRSLNDPDNMARGLAVAADGAARAAKQLQSLAAEITATGEPT